MKTVMLMKGRVDVEKTPLCKGCIHLPAGSDEPLNSFLHGCIISGEGVSNIFNIFHDLEYLNGKEVEIIIRVEE